ncbi:hypothetical protein ABFY09_06820 [Marinomonas sp. 5E14-1]|uniref:hypothetical protein n=1 Tax=Marinomonas sp. 5E14-1 TaxID=3153922 RepID=UPI003266E107
MAEVVPISLRHRLQSKAFALLSVIFACMCLIVFYLAVVLHQSFLENNFASRHKSVEQAFNNYLDHAEDEMRLITQDLSLNNYTSGRELDLLFGHHDALFFGELDFFYIEWSHGQHTMDPRARLFTQAQFRPLLQKGLINKWVSVTTEDNLVFLMHKKKIVSDEKRNIGFLYGFISLKENVTFASVLLGSGQVAAVRISDKSSGTTKVLLEESKIDQDATGKVLFSSWPLMSSVQADLELEVGQRNKALPGFAIKVLPFVLAVGFVMLVFYFLLMYQIRRYVFVPIEQMAHRSNKYLLPYKELLPLQQRAEADKTFLESKEQRFQLLTESVHCAIIFCNEVTEIETINAEARKLFPDSKKARTIFDFMPISCHQNIQAALKGEVGVKFDITSEDQRCIYKWQAHSFVNESGYQGLLLIGLDMTKEISLIWQLEQLQPLSVAAEKRVNTEAMQSELTYLSRLPQHITAAQLRGWIALLTSVLDDIGNVDEGVAYLPFGELLAQESAHVVKVMGIEANRMLLDCPLEVGVRVVAVNTHLRSLMRVLFMMVMSNDMEERRLSIKTRGSEFELVVMHDMASRPLFFWMIKAVLDSLEGEKKVLRYNALQLNLRLEETESVEELEVLPNELLVAWIVTDYPNASVVQESLAKLGASVEKYASTDSFFTQTSEVVKFDVVLISCDQDMDSQRNMTEALKLKYQRDKLPIIWLNSIFPKCVDPDVFSLVGCPSDYVLHKALLGASQLEGIMPIQSNNQTNSWVIVGGSRVSKAIWHAELETCDLGVQWLADLSNYSAMLSYHPLASLVLLESQPSLLLQAIQTSFPDVRFFSVQRWDEMPDNVAIFEMKQPYSGEQIRRFTEYVTQEV